MASKNFAEKITILGLCAILLLIVIGGLAYFKTGHMESAKISTNSVMKQKINNPVGYFEIPVVDLERAVTFYKTVFGYEFELVEIDGNQMALFPKISEASGITGALAKGDSYIPGKQGSRLYFSVESIETILHKAELSGGKLLYPKTSIGDLGFVAEFEDSEGNCIALHSER